VLLVWGTASLEGNDLVREVAFPFLSRQLPFDSIDQAWFAAESGCWDLLFGWVLQLSSSALPTG